MAKSRLLVPLDASKVTDFKPDRAVKVVAFDAKGRAYEDTVKLDGKGQGTASLSFESAPGGLQVVVGPQDATAEQMRGLQTISVEVAPRQWAGKAELTLSPVLIASYYWWWWWNWCRPFKITGVVRRSLRTADSSRTCMRGWRRWNDGAPRSSSATISPSKMAW